MGADHDYDLVGDLSDEAGLDKLVKQDIEAAEGAGKKVKTRYDDDEEEATAVNKTPDEDVVVIDYSIYANFCGSLENVATVRNYLDGGKLDEMFAKYEKLMVKGERSHFGPAYKFVFLGACAMTLGCQLRPTIRNLLKKTFPRASLPPQADEQMEAALIGTQEQIYKSGDPYHFNSPDLYETMAQSSKQPQQPNAMGFIGMNVPVNGMCNNPARTSKRKVVDETVVATGAYGPDRCAGCGVRGRSATPLLVCGRCKTTKYCDKTCQSQHWKQHKKGPCSKVGTGLAETGAVVDA